MERFVGTVSRGVRAPIIKQGDDIAQIVIDSVLAASKGEGFELRDRDVVAVTEAVVARAMGNYASVDQIAKDIKNKYGEKTIGVILQSALRVSQEEQRKSYLCAVTLLTK